MSGNGGTTPPDPFSLRFFQGMNRLLLHGLRDKDERCAEMEDLRRSLYDSCHMRPGQRVRWETTSMAVLAWERLAAPDRVATGVPSIVLAVATTSFVLHGRIGRKGISLAFTIAVVAMAWTLLFPRTEARTRLFPRTKARWHMSGNGGTTAPDTFTFRFFGGVNRILLHGLRNKDERCAETGDTRRCLYESGGVSRLQRVYWETASAADLAGERLTGPDGVPAGMALVLLDVATTSYLLHGPSAGAIGGKGVGLAFTIALLAMACTLLACPTLNRRLPVGLSAAALSVPAFAEAWLARMPQDQVDIGLRAGLTVIGLGLVAIACWSVSDKPWLFRAGIWVISVGAAVAGFAQLYGAWLLFDTDRLWSLSLALGGVATLWTSHATPRLIALVDHRPPTSAQSG
jgi:hypothetical protein